MHKVIFLQKEERAIKRKKKYRKKGWKRYDVE